MKPEYPQQNIWGKIWEARQHYFSFQINLCIGQGANQKLWLLKPRVTSWIFMNQIMENEPKSSRDALDLLLSGSQEHAPYRRWQVSPLNTHTAAQEPLLTARQHLGCDEPVMVHCFTTKPYLHPYLAADAKTTKNATDLSCWCEEEKQCSNQTVL